jgi:P-type E1-E2 ATPase
LRVGDIVLVRPGGRVPADGTVVEGAADVEESMITGESKTVSKAAVRLRRRLGVCREREKARLAAGEDWI